MDKNKDYRLVDYIIPPTPEALKKNPNLNPIKISARVQPLSLDDIHEAGGRDIVGDNAVMLPVNV